MEVSLNELRSLLASSGQATAPLFEGEKMLVVVAMHGFVFVGPFTCAPTSLTSLAAKNIRYWSKREDGLPGLAKSGPQSEDRIDGPVSVTVPINSVVCIYDASEVWRA